MYLYHNNNETFFFVVGAMIGFRELRPPKLRLCHGDGYVDLGIPIGTYFQSGRVIHLLGIFNCPLLTLTSVEPGTYVSCTYYQILMIIFHSAGSRGEGWQVVVLAPGHLII